MSFQRLGHVWMDLFCFAVSSLTLSLQAVVDCFMGLRLGTILPPLPDEKWCTFNGFCFVSFNVHFKIAYLPLLICLFFFDLLCEVICTRSVQMTLWDGTLSIQSLGILGNHGALYNCSVMSCN